MPRKILPRIVAVAPGEQPMTLRVRWDSGKENLVDVSGMMQGFRVYAPLRDSPDLFRRVRVGEYGTDVVWTDEIDMAADTLWRLAQEQSGDTMTPAAFRRWRERKAYTLDDAARALGLSRRIVAYYEKGGRPIPRVVALATRALDLSSTPRSPSRGKDGEPDAPAQQLWGRASSQSGRA
jgi:DNA-binding XRE family transcriptional regulator